MPRITLSIVTLTLCFLASSSAVHFIFCPRGVNISAAMARPTDSLEVYYMEAPAFEGAFGNLFKSLGGYHSAFGIINRSTNQTWTLEYDAVSEVLK
jgi:hypothetical protein